MAARQSARFTTAPPTPSPTAWATHAKATGARATQASPLQISPPIACAGSCRLLPHEVAGEQQGDGGEGGVGEGDGLRDLAGDGGGVGQFVPDDAEGVEYTAGEAAALGLPGVALAEVAAVGDEHD